MSREERLRDLWIRRDGLTREEWEQLGRIIFAILLSRGFREYSGLPNEKRHDLITDFIMDKVLNPNLGRDNAPDNERAIAYYYRRYLRSRIRAVRAKARREVQIGTVPFEGGAERTGDIAIPDGTDTQVTSTTWLPRHAPDPSFTREEWAVLESRLGDSGLTYEKIVDNARTFLDVQDKWSQIMLGHYFLESETPLYKFAKERGIPNYHQRAAKLGLTVGWKHGGEALENFSDTRMGRWVRALPIELSKENVALIDIALKILGDTAFTEYTSKE